MATKAPIKKAQRDQNFYEYMPGAYAPSNLGASDYRDDYQNEDEVDPEVRKRVLQQTALLIGLLVMQIVLFVVLIQSTIRLG